jgi:type IV fimbrial biogenesis protein FimT
MEMMMHILTLRKHSRAEPSARRSTLGFTITETMLAIAVLAILVGLAAPGFREIILSQAVKTASFDLFSNLVVARSEAIARNTTVTVTPTGGNWAKGWTITDSTGEVVGRQDKIPQVLIAGPGTITFNSAGRLTTGSTSISLMANGGQATHNRCIEINLGGRPATKKGACI